MKKKIFIAGGGTGGHIYPGLAIARSILKINPQIDIHFVGTSTGLETKIIPRENFPLHLLSGGKLNFKGKFFEKMKTLLKLPWGFLKSIFLLMKYRPDFVLGVGGYASGPFVCAARLLGISAAIWEGNAIPGLANRWLSHFVPKCYVVFPESKSALKSPEILNFGMPVREEIEDAQQNINQNLTEATIQRTDDNFHLLSFGGSQGARAISTVLCDSVTKKTGWTDGLKLVHQIGAVDFNKVKEKYIGFENIVTPVEFIYDMPRYYRWADLVVARGGASTIAELTAFGLVPIIIPLPAADNHQQKNAESLVKANAGVMILQSELTVERLVKEIELLRKNKEAIASMKKNLLALFKPYASRKIAEDILKSIGQDHYP